MSKNIKSITNPKTQAGDPDADEEVKKIHEATLWIIENVGVRFPSERALEIWEAHGAEVDRTNDRQGQGRADRSRAEDTVPRLPAGRPRSRTGSASGWQSRLPGHRWMRRGGDRHRDGAAPDVQAAGRRGYCPIADATRGSRLPLGAGLGAGYAGWNPRPARDQGHLGELHQARADRKHLQRARGAGARSRWPR